MEVEEKHEEETDLLKTDAVVKNTRSALICTTSCLADIKNQEGLEIDE